jgi:predicted dehydrogenase
MTSAPALRLGVIGVGRIAQVAHLPAATKAHGVRLVAVCDPSPKLASKVATSYGVRGWTDVDRLLEDRLDAVLVAAPDRLHLDLASRALAAGKHVLVEKPLAASAEEAALLAERADRAGLKLQVGAMKRHDPGIAYAHRALERIGPVTTAQAWYRVMAALRPPTEATLFPRVVVDDEVRAAEAGFKSDRERYLLTTHGAHVFDGLNYLVGGLASVRAEVAQVGPDYSWHGTGRLLASGGLASFEISANVHGQWSEGLDIYGEKGHVRVRSFFPFFKRSSEVSLFLEEDLTSVRPSFGDTDPYERQLEAFARAVMDGTPTNPDAHEGVAAVRFIEAVRQSAAAHGRPVAL